VQRSACNSDIAISIHRARAGRIRTAAIAGAYFTGFLLPAVQRVVHSGDTSDRSDTRNWCIQGLSIYFIATVSGTCNDCNAAPSVRADRIVRGRSHWPIDG